MKNKILFIDAKRDHIEVESRYPHLGFGYLASQVRKTFGQDYFELRIARHPFRKEIKDFEPDVVCISSVSSNFNIAKQIARAAKDHSAAVIIGGPHISCLPETMDGNMDVAVLHEGEITFVNLMKVYDTAGNLKPENIRHIKGIAFHEDGRISVAPPQELIEDLDSIPLPARDLMDIERHTNVFTTRGCPFRCTFCASSPYWKKVRSFSSGYIVSEIMELYHRYGVRFIGFYDDLFSYNKKKIAEIITQLDSNKLLGKIKFSTHCRVGSVDDELARYLSELGVVSASFGIESGNDRVMQYHKGQNVSTERALSDIEKLKKKGIHVNASFIIGAPGESLADIEDTMRFIKKSRLELFEIYLLEPWPGSRLWEHAVSRKLVSTDMDWDRLNVNFGTNKDTSLIVSDVLSREQLWKAFTRLQREKRKLALLNLYKHPFIVDAPRMAMKLGKQYLSEIFMTLTGAKRSS